jgi:xylulose-5-phosphate/fructose-6-phosphate phosphoketolase
LAGDVIDRVPGLAARCARQKRLLHDQLIEHKLYIARYGDDMPAIRDWLWS